MKRPGIHIYYCRLDPCSLFFVPLFVEKGAELNGLQKMTPNATLGSL